MLQLGYGLQGSHYFDLFRIKFHYLCCSSCTLLFPVRTDGDGAVIYIRKTKLMNYNATIAQLKKRI